MSLSAHALAEHEQNLASDPAVSSFVAASAGSGKTKLLTDRLLRLMLTGAAPEKIQCLTFTKAAAAEMAIRLQRVLAEWVRLTDTTLDEALKKLGITPGEERRATARNLFARVLDLPGGMRIGTIHAFCQSVLRRFPLEAEISPHFRLVDERDTVEALSNATESTLARARGTALSDAVETLAGLINISGFDSIVRTLHARRTRLDAALLLPQKTLHAKIRRALDLTAETDAEILSDAIFWQDEPALAETARILANQGSPGVQNKAGEILAWLGLDQADRTKNWPAWQGIFLRADLTPRGLSVLVNKKLSDAQPELAEEITREQNRILDAEATRRDLDAAKISAALLALIAPLLDAYAAGKTHAAQVDYDDLIGRTAKLLVDPGAGWVLYKLDGGLDHLLLDEVQDTAPAQWEIAGALTQEFFSGTSARTQRRTMFAVGDRKQSIYSFQGADPDAFDHWRKILRARVQNAGEQWRDVTLDVSFRSTEPILRLVDAVFADAIAADGVTLPGNPLKHFSHRAEHAGRVELFPVIQADTDEPEEPWAVARENRTRHSAREKLAQNLATWIAHETSGKTLLPSRGRMLAPGDVLVLVRRRDAFASALVRALKGKNVPVAGLDRLVLTDQPAVQDLLTLGDVLLLPDDSLALANFLVSPIGGLTHQSLEDLAVPRTDTLWQALRAQARTRKDWQAAHDFLSALLSRVDFSSPHALYTEALGALGARAKIFARLGTEAEEPLAEFLNAALSYTRLHPPSLQGFLHWLRRSGAEVKREQEEAGTSVRVMTVHGAKGLQAPLVILPDTTGLPRNDESLFWTSAGSTTLPIFTPNKFFRGAAAERLREEEKARRAQEYNRLLYVALTRAEDRLVICGWQDKKTADSSCWYSLVERGFSRLNPTRTPFPLWEGEHLEISSPQIAQPEPPKKPADGASGELPAWAGTAPDWRPDPPPAEPTLPKPLAPSRPTDASLGPIPQAASPLAARDFSGARFARGKLVHALLQHLPNLPPADRPAAALAWLTRPGHNLTQEAAKTLAAEVMGILDHEKLKKIFGPGSLAEVPLTGVVDGKIIGGLVDRLAVHPDEIFLVDYKTNRDSPARPEDTPVLYLRQMAAYRAVLAKIFPGREVVCALVWTRTAQPVILPAALLDTNAPHA